MKKQTYRVAGIIDPLSRNFLLRRFRPRFAMVHCFSLTWIYGCSADYADFPAGPHDCFVTGLYVGNNFDALRVRLGDDYINRPDGRPLTITLSVAEGVPPAVANTSFDHNRTVATPPMCVKLPLRLVPAWQAKPTPLADLRLSA